MCDGSSGLGEGYVALFTWQLLMTMQATSLNPVLYQLDVVEGTQKIPVFYVADNHTHQVEFFSN